MVSSPPNVTEVTTAYHPHRAFAPSMAELAGVDSTWDFTPPVGELRAGALCGQVDVSRPELGLNHLRLSGCALTGRLLRVFRESDDRTTAEARWPLSMADAYVRGNDLVATYHPADEWPYLPQIYWRAHNLPSIDGVIGSLSLLVSVQTDLLDTRPRIGASSQLACKEVLYLPWSGEKTARPEQLTRDRAIDAAAGDCCLVRRLAEMPLSYVEIMPASDFRTVSVRREGGKCGVGWDLFGEFLEKGVIRRARLQGVFVRREDDLQIAVACREAMERIALPLTT